MICYYCLWPSVVVGRASAAASSLGDQLNRKRNDHRRVEYARTSPVKQHPNASRAPPSLDSFYGSPFALTLELAKCFHTQSRGAHKRLRDKVMTID